MLNVSILIFQVSLPELAPLLSAVAGLVTGRSLEPLLISKNLNCNDKIVLIPSGFVNRQYSYCLGRRKILLENRFENAIC